MLLFDCTTLYFESFEPDRLWQPGYSKDGKFRETQVLLALMVTMEGLPVGYEVLPGASFEGHSLVPTLRRLRRAHDLRRVVCVADRGMTGEDNMAAMEAEGMHFIVGAKLKQLPGKRKAEILDAWRFRRAGRGRGAHPGGEAQGPADRGRPFTEACGQGRPRPGACARQTPQPPGPQRQPEGAARQPRISPFPVGSRARPNWSWTRPVSPNRPAGTGFTG